MVGGQRRQLAADYSHSLQFAKLEVNGCHPHKRVALVRAANLDAHCNICGVEVNGVQYSALHIWIYGAFWENVAVPLVIGHHLFGLAEEHF